MADHDDAAPGRARRSYRIEGISALQPSPEPDDWVMEVDPTPPAPLPEGEPGQYTVEGQLAQRGRAVMGIKQSWRHPVRWVRWTARFIGLLTFGPFVGAGVYFAVTGLVNLFELARGR